MTDIDDLHKQLEKARAERSHYGVHLATALKGDKLISEPIDWRLDKVREVVARNVELESLVKAQQAQIISIEVAWRHAKMLEGDL